MLRIAIVGLVIGLFVALPAWAEEEKQHEFVGVKKCKSCHKKEAIGDQYGAWKKAEHAKAFETLGSEDAKKLAAKQGIDDPQKADECLKCHVTAHGVDKKLIGKKFDPTMGVQCESCHGAGKDYRKKKVMVDHDKAVAKGLVIPDEKVCVVCHNDESPSWDPEKYETASGKVGFDYEQAAEKIAHPVPEDYDPSGDDDEEEEDD